MNIKHYVLALNGLKSVHHSSCVTVWGFLQTPRPSSVWLTNLWTITERRGLKKICQYQIDRKHLQFSDTLKHAAWCSWRTMIVYVCVRDKLAQDWMLLLCGGSLLWIVPDACVKERGLNGTVSITVSRVPFYTKCNHKALQGPGVFSDSSKQHRKTPPYPYLPTNSSATLPISVFSFLSLWFTLWLPFSLCLSYFSFSLRHTKIFSLSLIIYCST